MNKKREYPRGMTLLWNMGGNLISKRLHKRVCFIKKIQRNDWRYKRLQEQREYSFELEVENYLIRLSAKAIRSAAAGKGGDKCEPTRMDAQAVRQGVTTGDGLRRGRMSGKKGFGELLVTGDWIGSKRLRIC